MALQTDLNHTHLKVNHHLKKTSNNDLSKIYFSALDYWSRPQVVEDIRLVFALQENKENTRLVGRKMLRL